MVKYFRIIAHRRWLPVIGALALLSLFELLVEFPAQWVSWIILSVAVAILTGFFLTNFQLLVAGWWHTLFTPTLLAASTIALIIFLSGAPARQVTIVITVSLSLLFWENIWRYYWAREKYHEEALENTSLALNTVVVWYTSSFFFYLLIDPSILPSFFRDNILSVAAAVVVVTVFLLDYRTIWVQRYPPNRVWLILVAQSLVVSELFWVLNFLPHRVEVKAFLVVLAYYLFTNLGRSHLDGTLKQTVLRRYAYVAIISLLAVLLSARWIV